MEFYKTTLPLANSTNPGKQIPVLGYGCWQAAPGKVETAVEVALKEGYRHIDGAAIYGNEKEVGEGIKRSGVPRDEIWVTSKLWCNAHRPSEVEKALDKTLTDMDLDYLDLYLIHFPVAFQPGGAMIPLNSAGVAQLDTETTLADTWKAMEALLATGKVKNIGISNFSKPEVEELLTTAKVKPASIQLELHPYLAQLEYTDWLQKQGIVVVAYSPFGNLNPAYESKGDTRIVDTDVVKEIASRTRHTPAQVVLSFGISHNYCVIPKSENPDRVRENKNVFKLDPADLAQLDGLGYVKRYNDPSATFGKVLFADEKGGLKAAVQNATLAARSVLASAQEAVGLA